MKSYSNYKKKESKSNMRLQSIKLECWHIMQKMHVKNNNNPNNT